MFRISGNRWISVFSRLWSGTSGAQGGGGKETAITKLLKDRFPKATQVKVEDVSGGCGAMYEIFVETSEFKGLNTIKQHRAITETLKEQIKEMHGLRIFTKIPKE